MNRNITPWSDVRPLSLKLCIGLLLIVGVAFPMVANAASIRVDNPTDLPLIGHCNLRQAIVAHNQKTTPIPSICTKGDGNDTILIGIFPGDRIIDSGSPLPAIANGTLTIRPIETGSACVSIRQSSYMKVNKGATLNLEGIGVVVNGAEFLSPIDNDGGTLNVYPHAGNLLCLSSNQNGKDRVTSHGGILNNRNGGTATINARFESSRASNRGGAIYVDSGTVTIAGGSFANNRAFQGGAIFVSRGATLNIRSSNFSINNNSSHDRGGAIFSSGGIVNLQRDSSQALASVSIEANSSFDGGGLFADGGKLNIDGIQFASNSARHNGGAVWVSHFTGPNPASITRSYFQDNRASNKRGSSIFATGGAIVNASQDTFLRNFVGMFLESLATVNIINSTILGSTASGEGVSTDSGSAKLTFSTLVGANFSGRGKINIGNSILQGVGCRDGAVVDDDGNLQYQSPLCPNAIPVGNPLLDPLGLKDNGGATPTIALTPSSPAIDQIEPPNCVDLAGNRLTIDQRGFSRPATGKSNCDIGAYEFGAVAAGVGIGGVPPNTTF